MKFLVYRTVKKRLGLSDAKFVIYGAAPLSLSTRQFFFDLNIFLNNLYGMSETAGPITGLFP
jgi:long-chain-fatty-acid--CoA ligase ACSBG